MLMPLQGDITLNVHIPRAMPWADNEKPLQGITQHSLNNYVSIIPCILFVFVKKFLIATLSDSLFLFVWHFATPNARNALKSNVL